MEMRKAPTQKTPARAPSRQLGFRETIPPPQRLANSGKKGARGSKRPAARQWTGRKSSRLLMATKALLNARKASIHAFSYMRRFDELRLGQASPVAHAAL